MRLGYARVSKQEQDNSAQIAALKQAGWVLTNIRRNGVSGTMGSSRIAPFD
jgi:DNA invertase Pin-like site-specific DNA recombinase